LQSSVALTLTCESRPSLVGAKHRAHRGRVHFAHLRTIRRIGGVVLAPVSCEDVRYTFRKLSSSQRSTEPPSPILTTMDHLMLFDLKAQKWMQLTQMKVKIPNMVT
jgi:hypothetical protein